jgi:7-carboxy-7-deazaguanine synthase
MTPTVKKIPVTEMFGPVIQGEGIMAGHQTYFIRLGGCDYECSWCDTLYSVKPQLFPEETKYLSQEELVKEFVLFSKLQKSNCNSITLSGGNPCMHKLGLAIQQLRDCGFDIAVETQGTLNPFWLKECQVVTLSPKPPSSNMPQTKGDRRHSLMEIVGDAMSSPVVQEVCLKIVVFDDIDYEWAKATIHMFDHLIHFSKFTVYLQTGSPISFTTEQIQQGIIERTKWLIDKVTNEKRFGHVRVMPQLHTILYGQRKGV